MPWATRATESGDLFGPRALPYVPYEALGGRPNVIVDGAATDGTVLTLSHWPGSPTPDSLRRDLSAESALDYLAEPAEWVDAEAVSNNHLDVDGVVSVFALVDPSRAAARRDLLVEVARAGDFSFTTDRVALRLALALEDRIAAGDDYDACLDRLAAWLDDPDDATRFAAAEEASVAADEARIAAGGVTIEEHPASELSVVTVLDGGPPLHPAALYPHLACFGVLTTWDGGARVDQRYEGWVTYVSRPVVRVDLRPLAAELSALDTVAWRAGAPSEIMPSLVATGPSGLDVDRVRALVESYHAVAAGRP